MCISLSVCQCICLSVFLCICLVYMSVFCLSVCLCICLSVRMWESAGLNYCLSCHYSNERILAEWSLEWQWSVLVGWWGGGDRAVTYLLTSNTFLKSICIDEEKKCFSPWSYWLWWMFSMLKKNLETSRQTVSQVIKVQKKFPNRSQIGIFYLANLVWLTGYRILRFKFGWAKTSFKILKYEFSYTRILYFSRIGWGPGFWQCFCHTAYSGNFCPQWI